MLRTNLSDAQVFHERIGWLDLGVNCPDASHMTRFNTLGNTPEIRAFWQQKLARDAAQPSEVFVETTHLHAKAGLIENLDLVPDGTRVVLVAQRRDPFKIAWSFYNRFEFTNFGFTWLFALDPRYHNVIVSSEPFREYNAAGSALWYVIEMEARGEYYRLMTQETPNVSVFPTALEQLVQPEGAKKLLREISGDAVADIGIPAPENVQPQHFFDEAEKAKLQHLVSRFEWNPTELAQSFIASGRRLAMPSADRSSHQSQQ